MPRLNMSLLGPYGVELDGKPVTAFASNKVRALLAYLATESGQPHRRETLAGLLWPDWPERSARANLRNALSNLRKVIGDQDAPQTEPGASTFLIVTRGTVQFNAASDHRLDVAAFQELVQADPIDERTRHRPQEAIALYRGPFLEGFSLADSPAFEDWALAMRKRLEDQVLETLQRLVAYDQGQGQLELAREAARRQIELAPWQEQAHQALMRLLALSGQRGAALAQYEICCRALREELDVEPGQATTQLYGQIRDGKLAAPSEATRAQKSKPPAAPSTRAGPVSRPQPTVGTEEELQGERRRVTALAICIRGEAGRGAPVDVETWAGAMHRLLPTLESGIARYGGEVERYQDEGLIALFGASGTHEDDPERAVLAALAIREDIQPALAELARQEQLHLALHAGIHTGEAIVTNVGERSFTWAASIADPALALAKQTDHTTEPGAAFVTEQTYRLVAPLFEWEPPDKSAAYRARAHKGVAGKGRGIEGLSSPLVGRDAELRALQDALAGLRDGIGGIVTVVGPAGIGKSRLVAEAQRPPNPKAPNLQWLEGRCLSYATNVAYHLWQDLLRSWLDVTPDAPLLAVRDALRERVQALCGDSADQVYPYLGRLLALPLEGEIEEKLRGLDGESQQFITFRAAETLLERAAAEHPLVVVCEDLHWADVTSLALLRRLLALTDRAPLLTICVLRPERAHACWQIVETAAREYAHNHTALTLEPLSLTASATLVGNLLRRDELGEAVRTRILEHAEGNPFYVEEILRSLIDDGMIVADVLSDDGSSGDESSGRWHTTRDVEDIPIPDTLHGVLAARIDRLPAEAKRVLQLASVIGRSFSYPVLSAVYSPLTPDPSPPSSEEKGERGEGLDVHLIALQRAQLIHQRRRVPERQYAFKHHLTQEAAYNGLLRRERQAIHKQVAEVLERLYPDHGALGRGEGQLSLLAHHWEQSEERERAIPYLRQTGERSAAQFANAEALIYFNRALDLAPQESMERYSLLLAREGVYELQGDREAQEQDLVALDEWAEAYGEGRQQAEVAVRRARFCNRTGDYKQALSAAQAAVRLAQDARDVGLEAMAYREWGRVPSYQGRTGAVQPQLERALALAREVGMRQVEAEILHTLGRFLNDGERKLACWEQELRICREIGDRRREGEALRDVGFSLCQQGDWSKGVAYIQQSLDVCRETGNRRDEAWALQFLGGMSNYQGCYAQAESYITQGLRICREVRDRVGEREGLWYLGYTHWSLADYAAARGSFEQSLRIHREMNNPGTSGWVHAALGLVFHLQGDYASAQAHYERGLYIGRKTDKWFVTARALMYAGLLSHHLGDDNTARQQAQEALHLIPDLDALLAVELYAVFAILGHALAGQGCLEEAADVYRQGLALHRARGQHHLAVEPLAGLARAALAQGDMEGALAHVREILDHMEDHPALAGTLEPLRIYLTCYRVLRANGDPRTDETLNAAYHLLRERAGTIEDEDLRRSYQENVPAHREIVTLWEETPHR